MRQEPLFDVGQGHRGTRQEGDTVSTTMNHLFLRTALLSYRPMSIMGPSWPRLVPSGLALNCGSPTGGFAR